MFYLAAVPPRISTFTENRTYQVSALATETRRHRSRRRHALVFRFRSDAQSHYFPCSPAFDQLRAFYIRNGSYKETFFICPRSSPPFMPPPPPVVEFSISHSSPPAYSQTSSGCLVLEIKDLARQENLNQETHRATS